MIPVQHRSDKYHVFDSVDFRRNDAKPRAPGTESVGSGFDVTQATYSAEVYALHQDIADQIRNNADPALDLDAAAAEFVMQQLMIQKEVNWMTDFFTTSIWGTDVVGDTDFTYFDDSSSDPEAEIDTGKEQILLDTGLEANTMVVSYQVHNALKRHPLITERYKHTSSDNITPAILARFFEVDRYIVSKASYTTSQEGGTEANSFIAGKHILLCHVAPNPGLLTPSAGYTFSWTPEAGGRNGVAVDRFRMRNLKADRVEGQTAYDHKAVLAKAGYFLSGAIS
jgi:hypothetical protein